MGERPSTGVIASREVMKARRSFQEGSMMNARNCRQVAGTGGKSGLLTTLGML